MTEKTSRMEQAIDEAERKIGSHVASIVRLAPDLSPEHRRKLADRLEQALKEVQNGASKSDTKRLEKK